MYTSRKPAEIREFLVIRAKEMGVPLRALYYDTDPGCPNEGLKDLYILYPSHRRQIATLLEIAEQDIRQIQSRFSDYVYSEE